MSVIEFFMNYWDWYLLIGVFFGIDVLLEKLPLIPKLWSFLVVSALWPRALVVKMYDFIVTLVSNQGD